MTTLAFGISELTNFQLKTYELPLLPPGTLRGADAFKVLHISDLHMIPGQDTKIAWVRALDALQPDLVINTGDNLSDLRGVPYVLDALEPLLNRPGAFVFGTNDYWAPRPVNPLKYLVNAKREPSYVDLPWEGMRAAFVERGWRDATHQRAWSSRPPGSSSRSPASTTRTTTSTATKRSPEPRTRTPIWPSACCTPPTGACSPRSRPTATT